MDEKEKRNIWGNVSWSSVEARIVMEARKEGTKAYWGRRTKESGFQMWFYKQDVTPDMLNDSNLYHAVVERLYQEFCGGWLVAFQAMDQVSEKHKKEEEKKRATLASSGMTF